MLSAILPFIPCNVLSLFWIASAVVTFCGFFIVSSDSTLNSSVFKNAYLFGKLKPLNPHSPFAVLSLPKRQFVPITYEAMEQWSDEDLTFVCRACVFLDDRTFDSIKAHQRWFAHFYVFGLTVHSCVCLLFVTAAFGFPFPPAIGSLIYWIKWPCTSLRVQEIGLWSVLLAFIFMWLQMARRAYECLFLSSFSAGTMSIVHYFYGIFLYSSMGIGLISAVDLKFKASSSFSEMCCCLVAVVIFCWASYFQHKSMRTFAALRTQLKDKNCAGHYIPRGHLFELVSCPHYLCEIIIYFTFCLLFTFTNSFMSSIFLFVCSNQILSAVLTHHWYRQTFSSYPPDRKAIIPYVL